MQKPFHVFVVVISKCSNYHLIPQRNSVKLTKKNTSIDVGLQVNQIAFSQIICSIKKEICLGLHVFSL